MKYGTFFGAGIIVVGTLAGAALAASPTQADMDSCNQKAAQASKGGAGQAGAGAATSGTPQPSRNPTGGRVTDSSQPGTPPSALGMAPAGETNQAYRQAYLACLKERTK